MNFVSVDKYNFQVVKSEIEKLLKGDTHFISFDLEFTGIYLSEESFKSSYLGVDDFEIKYQKFKKAVEVYKPYQFGLCLWNKSELLTSHLGCKRS